MGRVTTMAFIINCSSGNSLMAVDHLVVSESTHHAALPCTGKELDGSRGVLDFVT